MTARRDASDRRTAKASRTWSKRVRDAEQDYLACLSEFGCESGEAFSAQWHLRQVKRLALRHQHGPAAA